MVPAATTVRMAVSIQPVTPDERGLAPLTALRARLGLTGADPLSGLVRRPDFADRVDVWSALDGDRVAGRAAGILSPSLHDATGEPLGLIACYEAEDHPVAGASLLRAVCAGLRARGARRVVGPMDGDTWHRYRWNVGPHDMPSFFLEPTNPPYYAAQWRSAGFVPCETYTSKRIDAPDRLADRLSRVAARVHRSGYRFVPLDPTRFDAALDQLHVLSLGIFAGNVLYTDLSRDAFGALYADARRVIDPDFVAFATSPDGAAAGFVFALPDLQPAIDAMRGRRHLLARLRFLRARRRVCTLNVKTIGVLPAHRSSGLGAALLHYVYVAAVRRGYTAVNHCLMHADNASADLDRGLGHVFRNYELYAHDA